MYLWKCGVLKVLVLIERKDKGIISGVVLKRIDDINLNFINKKIEFFNRFTVLTVIKTRR